MSTKRTISEAILRRLSAGNPSVASKVHPLEIDAAVAQVLNTLLRTQYFETLQLDSNIPEGCVLAYYDNVAVISYKGVSKCVLPAIPVSLPKNMGVFSVKPHSEDNSGTDGGGSEGDTPTVQNFGSFTYNQLTGELVFEGTATGYETRISLHNPETPLYGYINSENKGFSVSPFTGNTLTMEYLTPGNVLVKWQQLGPAPSYAELTPYKEFVLAVTRLSRRYLRVWNLDTSWELGEGFAPVNVYNIEGDISDTATTIDEVVSVWNADPVNSAFGTIIAKKQFPVIGWAQYYELQIEPVASATAYPISKINVDLVS